MAMPTALAQREQTLALEAFRARVRTEVLAAIAEHKAALRDSALSADDYNKIRRLHDDKVARHRRTRTLTRTRTLHARIRIRIRTLALRPTGVLASRLLVCVAPRVDGLQLK